MSTAEERLAALEADVQGLKTMTPDQFARICDLVWQTWNHEHPAVLRTELHTSDQCRHVTHLIRKILNLEVETP